MQWIGKGKVTVASSGTPVALSVTKVAINTLLITYDPADSGATVYIKDNNNNVIAAMSSAAAPPIQITAPGGNQLDLRNFQIDSGTNGKGPYVGYGVD
jgi:hypothetical protein